jgi:hypothetical protein
MMNFRILILTVCAGDYSKLARKTGRLNPHPGNKFFIPGRGSKKVSPA